MLSIRSIAWFARHLHRYFRDSFVKYEWNDWEVTEFEGEKFLSWSFGNSAEDVRMSVDMNLPMEWSKEDELNLARLLSALAV